jgi:hypothetical protein
VNPCAGRRVRRGQLLVVSGLVAICAACSGSYPTQPHDPADPPPAPPGERHVLVGAADIGWCGSTAAAATGRLVDSIDGTVFAAGDLAYMSGTARDFAQCYDPVWGRFKSRTFPSPGNHEYETPGAQPYYQYFGSNAGPPGLGYYSYDRAGWHIISLNSEAPASAGSAQMSWLRADLTTNRALCTIAYWHHPVFSSGQNGPQQRMRDVWRVLYDAGVEVVINGHDHSYERFAPMDGEGRADADHGIRQFIVGTGGAPLYPFNVPRPNSERRSSAHGVLKITIQGAEYAWEFLPVFDAAAADSGRGVCH